MRRGPVRVADLSEREVALWSAFLDAYTATRTRAAVDVFLRALLGAPKQVG